MTFLEFVDRNWLPCTFVALALLWAIERCFVAFITRNECDCAEGEAPEDDK